MLMSHIYLGIGSNDKPKENIRLAIKELRGFFGKIQISPVYKNKAVGFKGEDFLFEGICQGAIISQKKGGKGFMLYRDVKEHLRNFPHEHSILICFYMAKIF